MKRGNACGPRKLLVFTILSHFDPCPVCPHHLHNCYILLRQVFIKWRLRRRNDAYSTTESPRGCTKSRAPASAISAFARPDRIRCRSPRCERGRIRGVTHVSIAYRLMPAPVTRPQMHI